VTGPPPALLGGMPVALPGLALVARDYACGMLEVKVLVFDGALLVLHVGVR